jgi:PKD repeat protein
MKRLFFISALSILAFSCASVQDPVTPYEALTADFTILNSPVTATHLVQIENNSKGASSYSWNLGNGTSCTDKLPTVTYPAEGTYAITLTTTNSSGETAVAVHEVTVVPL